MENNVLDITKSCEKLELIKETISSDLGIDFISIDEVKSDSSLDVIDYFFTLLFGMIGAILGSSEKVEEFFAKCHDAASESQGDYKFIHKVVGNLFHHKKDHIDIKDAQFMNRNGNHANVGFHRLLWGHDIFSQGEDNPFKLMINQKGSFLNGILLAFRHLIADTMSKQGLPIPGSSFLDMINEDGKDSNYLIELSKQFSIDSAGNNKMTQDIFSHMFTIRMQDVAGGSLVKILTEIYFKVRKIDDKLRKAQITFMSYAIDFFGQALIGAIKQNGVPYVNIPVGSAMMVSFVKFIYLDNKEINQLTKETNRLIEVNDDIVLIYELHNDLLNHNVSEEDFINELNNCEGNMDILIDFLKVDKE